MHLSNNPTRKRVRQEQAMERMTVNIHELDKVIATKPENVDALKDHKQRLVDSIENTKKNLR